MLKKIKIKQLTVFELLELSWRVYMKNIGLIALIILTAFLPVSIFLPLRLTYLPEMLQKSRFNFFCIESFLLLFFFFMETLSLLMLVQIVEHEINQKKKNLWKMVQEALKRLTPAIFTSLICITCVLILAIFLLVPGIIFAIYSIFILYAVTLRKMWGIKAIWYSFILIQDSWWRILWIMLLFGLLHQAINFMIFSILGISFWGLVVLILLMVFVLYYFEVAKVILFLNQENLFILLYPDFEEELIQQKLQPNQI